MCVVNYSDVSDAISIISELYCAPVNLIILDSPQILDLLVPMKTIDAQIKKKLIWRIKR